MVISQDKLEALSELFHISNGKAAASLSALVGGLVHMAPPVLKVLTPPEATGFIQGRYSGWTLSIKMSFDGLITGDAFLLLDDASGRALFSALFGEHPEWLLRDAEGRFRSSEPAARDRAFIP